MQRRDVKRVAIVLVTGDRGLAGPFNGQVLRRAFELERQERAEGHEVAWTVVGRKGASTLRFRRYELAAQWAGFVDRPEYRDAQAVAHQLAELYTKDEVDRVVLVYNRFESALVQRVTIDRSAADPRERARGGEEDMSARAALRGDFIYEPEPEEILAAAAAGLPRDGDLPRAARVGGVVPRRADDRDAERVEERRRADRHLTLQMNRARQAQITQEILEIVAGADALTR